MKRLLPLTALVLAACASAPKVPPQAPPAVKVLVPVPVPCKVEKVAKSPLVTEQQPVAGEIFEAVKQVLADRAILKGDRERMAAANNDPCPER